MFLLYGFAILIADLHFVAYGQMRTGLNNSKQDIFKCSELIEPFVGTRHLPDMWLEGGRAHMRLTSCASGLRIERLGTLLTDFLYGRNASANYQELDINQQERNTSEYPDMYASGRVMHAELFLNRSGVHLPPAELMQIGKCRLAVTQDFLQTAVDAFAIILEGSIADVLALPSDYVLHSARTISMMKIPLEKMSLMWEVVLNGTRPEKISYETLEMYRPLFKYLSGKQMARLNLSNPKIVSYIGTHPDLNRRQVGVVAKKYIKTNTQWHQSKHLSTMNNLLCGVPMSFMRKLDEAVYLRLEHQVFYHIRACDPLQRRFYLNMMTRTQALGKPFSWSGRDVSRLGLLMAEVDGPALAGIRPEAMSGITAHVMAEIKPENMQYITEMQMEYINLQAKKILAKKLKRFELEMEDDRACPLGKSSLTILLLVLILPRILIKQYN